MYQSAVHAPSERKFGSSRYHGYHFHDVAELSETATRFILSSYVEE